VKFDSNRAWEHLRQLVAIGPRPSGSAAIEQSRTYIKNQLAASGLIAVEQKWTDETPAGRVPMVNLTATIPGARKDRIVIAGHYDTKRFTRFRFVGASDGGSSAAFLIELARTLKGRPNGFTVELLFLDGEEAVNEVWAGSCTLAQSTHDDVDLSAGDGSLNVPLQGLITTVKTAAGVPLTGYSVTATGPCAGAATLTLPNTSSGASKAAIPAGTWTVKVVGPGGTQTKSVIIAPGQGTANADFVAAS